MGEHFKFTNMYLVFWDVNLGFFILAQGLSLSGSNLPDLEKDFNLTDHQGAFFSKSL